MPNSVIRKIMNVDFGQQIDTAVHVSKYRYLYNDAWERSRSYRTLHKCWIEPEKVPKYFSADDCIAQYNLQKNW